MPRAEAMKEAAEAVRGKGSGFGGSFAGGARRGGGGIHFQPPPVAWNGPPPGSFDPGIRAQVEQSERGLLDLEAKLQREGHREGVDTHQARNLLQRKIEQGRADLATQRGYATQDAYQKGQQLQVNFGRDLTDLATAKQRGGEDFQRALVELQHKYASATQVQGEHAVQQGTDEFGSNAAGAAVRGANAAHDTGALDLQHSRAEADLAQRQARDTTDYATNQGLLQQGLNRQLFGYDTQGQRLGLEDRTQQHALGRQQFRAVQDRATELSHARREEGFFSVNSAQQAFYQAHKENPNILIPPPAALGSSAFGAPAAPRPPGPPRVATGTGGGTGYPTYGPNHTPHVHNPVTPNVGLAPAVSYPGSQRPNLSPRRAYTRI